MADPIPLKFQPRWDRIGDADKTGFAILYGIIAMTTVWLFENLVENLLFPSNMTISISDAAALLTFQGASWVDIVKWNSKSHRGNRRNRRAYIAVLLRLAITLVDVFIVFLSIPQEMKVLESDVGRPELNLSNLSKKGNKLLNDTNFSELSVCTWDKTTYDGFTPNSAILICFTSTDLYPSPNAEISIASQFLNLEITHDVTTERITFTTSPTKVQFFITHNLFIPASEGKPDITYTYPLPRDIASQSANALEKDSKFRRNNCTRASNNATAFNCPSAISIEDLRREVITRMLFNIWTEPIRPKTFPKVKFTAGGVEIDETIQALGSFNRPYLCVVPALILIAILTMLNLVWKFSISSNNIFENVYNYVVGTLVENTATTGNRNPFYSNDGEETNRNTGNVEGSFREQEPKALAVTNDRIMKPQEIYVST